MSQEDDAPAAEAAPAAAEANKARPARATPRTDLKHVGAYLDRETVEKVAILRARLRLDNSQLVKLAVEELYARQEAKKAFGDA